MKSSIYKSSNNTIITKQVKDLLLSEDVITDVDLSNIDINIDDALSLSSENPVQNKVITNELNFLVDNIDDISSDINILSANKLNITDVTDEISATLSAPISSRAIHELTSQFQDRISQLEYITNVKLAYTTNLEVFPTLEDLSAGTPSTKEARIDRLLSQTNTWSNKSEYIAGTIVTKYSNKDVSLTQMIGIYRAKKDITLQDLSVDTYSLYNSQYWEDITQIYLDIQKNEAGEIEKYYHKFIEAVPKSSIQILKFKSVVEPNEQNIIVNWGDGTKSHLSLAKENTDDVELNNDTIIVEHDENGYIYSCYHDYANSLNSEGVSSKYYIIEIIGNKFSGLTSDKDHNIISNIFSDNFQFYLNCVDIEGLIQNSKKILYVSCSDYDNAILSVHNIKSLFESCVNLQYVIGFYELTGINTMISMERMFYGCKNLLNCDVRIAKSLAVNSSDNGNSEVYAECENLSTRLRALLPSNGFDSRIVTLKSTFKNCKNLFMRDITSTGIEMGEPKDTQHVNNILFRDTSKIFVIEKPFEGCTILNSITKPAVLVPDNWK